MYFVCRLPKCFVTQLKSVKLCYVTKLVTYFSRHNQFVIKTCDCVYDFSIQVHSFFLLLLSGSSKELRGHRHWGLFPGCLAGGYRVSSSTHRNQRQGNEGHGYCNHLVCKIYTLYYLYFIGNQSGMLQIIDRYKSIIGDRFKIDCFVP